MISCFLWKKIAFKQKWIQLNLTLMCNEKNGIRSIWNDYGLTNLWVIIPTNLLGGGGRCMSHIERGKHDSSIYTHNLLLIFFWIFFNFEWGTRPEKGIKILSFQKFQNQNLCFWIFSNFFRNKVHVPLIWKIFRLGLVRRFFFIKAKKSKLFLYWVSQNFFKN